MFLGVLLWSSHVLGQAVGGVIVDEFKQPIREVNILNQSTEQHAHSDERGRFEFEKLSIGDTLYISHISYESKYWVIHDLDTDLSIELKTRLMDLEAVIIKPTVNSLRLITDLDVEIAPINSSQDLLRKVPGLFIGQHAGGGKAEQIFLRGFDIDHGTDIQITVDGLPVNMVSHAHGQGYADVHFVIPETVDRLDFGKGPYRADKGNFTTAGYVDFATKKELDYSTLKLEVGQFNTQRLLGMFKLVNTDQHDAYVAAEYNATDGPFESPQNFHRINLFGKYNGMLSNSDQVGVTASYFTSKWDASGQIPQRAVDNQAITRFGAIDDTEGGQTSRANIQIHYHKIIDNQSELKSMVYFSNYNFELYSNFTFFLEDSLNGDQIRQRENRNMFGARTAYKRRFSLGKLRGNIEAGMTWRNDQSNDNELSRSRNRIQTLESIQLGNINETNLEGYLGATIHLDKWMFNASVRVDYFDFQYNDALIPAYQTQTTNKALFSPKVNLAYNASQALQLYVKAGRGFHSNDTRVVLAETGREILPIASGLDVGTVWKPIPKMLFNLAYWYLYLEQEFVYVGDAGIVEPSGQTQRQGVELSYRYQILPWLFWSLDANYTLARAVGEPQGANYIPLAPDFTLTSGVSVMHPWGIYGGVYVRHINDRPANEDFSIVAEGYTVVDLNIGYKFARWDFGIQIQNLLNTSWNEAQFATESQLRNEATPTEELHFTPGTPFFLRGVIAYKF